MATLVRENGEFVEKRDWLCVVHTCLALSFFVLNVISMVTLAAGAYDIQEWISIAICAWSLIASVDFLVVLYWRRASDQYHRDMKAQQDRMFGEVNRLIDVLKENKKIC